MFSAECRYAIRAAVALARRNQPELRIGAKDLATRMNLPAPFLAKILKKMSQKGVLQSMKGPNGGFYLNEKDLNRSMWQLVTALECGDTINNCVLGLTECNEKTPCAMHYLYAPFKNTFIQKMQQKNLHDFAKESGGDIERDWFE